MRVLELFAGAGGMSLGLQRAGLHISGWIERDKHAYGTHAAALGPSYHKGLAQPMDAAEIDYTGWRGLVDLIAGGPPCQPFSVAGAQSGLNDPRDGIPIFLRAVDEARPEFFLMENVPGLMTPKFLPYFQSILQRAEAMGYQTVSSVLDAADYGAPQHRRRLIILGRLEATPPPMPFRTHGPGRLAHVTVQSALDDLQPGEPNTARVVYAKNPVVRCSPYAGMLVNGQGRPLDPLRPAPTITATSGGNRTHFLDTENQLRAYHAEIALDPTTRRVGDVPGARRLTYLQCARLQGFPDDWPWQGPPSSRYRQIGNAVPVQLAEALGNSMRDQSKMG